jgi:BppU N-terminal domain/Phage tail repeat like
MLKEFGITLDLTRDVSNETFSINQNDLNNIQINFNFLNEGAPIDLTGGTIRVAIKKPNHFTVIQDAEIIDMGKAQVLLNTQSYNENGDCIGEVYLYQGDQTHVFKSKFKYFVIEAIMNDEIVESSNEWQSINDALLNYIPRNDVEVIVDSKIDEMAANGELSVSTNWENLTNKPTAFEPIDHTHVMADITDLDLSNADIDLSSKADVIHTHTIADVTDLQTILNSKADDSDLLTKANSIHTHAITDVTNLQTTLNSKADDSDLATKANLNHTHEIADITNLQTTLNAKADDSDLTTKANVSDLETKADLNHIHAITDVTNLQTALDSKADDVDLTTKADVIHSHGIEDVTDLQTILNSKADDSDLTTKANAIHTHLWADITDKPTTFEPTDHTHTVDEITDLDVSTMVNRPQVIFQMSNNVLMSISANVMTKVTYQVFNPNIGNGLNPSLHRFVAPVTGYYQIFYHVFAINFPVGAKGIIASYVNGASNGWVVDETVSVAGNKMFDAAMLVSLNQGDYLEMYFQTSVNIDVNYNYMYGYLL